MNTKIKINAPVSATPYWRQKILVILLIVSSVAGYAITARLFFGLAPEIQPHLKHPLERFSTQKSSPNFSLLDSIFADETIRAAGKQLENVRDQLQRNADKKHQVISLTFNGSMRGKDGTVAMINRQAVSVGSEIQGIKIVAISDQTLTLEYKGETQEMSIGQTVSVELR